MSETQKTLLQESMEEELENYTRYGVVALSRDGNFVELGQSFGSIEEADEWIGLAQHSKSYTSFVGFATTVTETRTIVVRK